MIYIILIILVVLVLIKISNLSTSVQVLQSEVKNLKKKKGLEAGTVSSNQTMYDAPTLGAIHEEQTVPMQNIPQSVNAEPEFHQENQISAWFKENLILKIGVIMILAGFGWFVSYAFAQNWIGPVGRITLGVVVGVLTTLFGTIRLGKNKTQGVAFTILGSALVIMTLLAGQYFYGYFSYLSVLIMVFVISLYVSICAASYSFENLAVYGLLVSLFAPYLSHTSNIDPVTLYLYLLIVSITTIWISGAKNWRIIIPIGITGILFYSLPFFFEGVGGLIVTTKYAILFIVYTISVLYLVINIYSIIKNQTRVSTGDVYLTIVNTMILLGFTVTVVPTIYQSLVIAGWMLAYALTGFVVYEKTKNEKMFFIHSLISILLLAIATSIELSGQTLVIAFSIESAIIAVASFVVTGKIKIAKDFGILMIVPLLLTLPSFISSKWQTGIFHSDFAVLLVLAVLLLVLGIFYKANDDDTHSVFKVHHLSFILATFYIYSIIWLSSHYIFMNSDMGVFVSLLVFTVVGLVTHFVGLFKHHIVMKKYGMTLLILIVIRLIFVDVWNMELSLRIITFVVLGVLFISTAFISKNQNKVVSQFN
ncbi:MAG: DUF2339 domain-containing protein [Patescibacteria group bacterium]